MILDHFHLDWMRGWDTKHLNNSFFASKSQFMPYASKNSHECLSEHLRRTGPCRFSFGQDLVTLDHFHLYWMRHWDTKLSNNSLLSFQVAIHALSLYKLTWLSICPLFTDRCSMFFIWPRFSDTWSFSPLLDATLGYTTLEQQSFKLPSRNSCPMPLQTHMNVYLPTRYRPVQLVFHLAKIWWSLVIFTSTGCDVGLQNSRTTVFWASKSRFMP